MKVVKIKKKWYSNWEKMYQELDAIFQSHVFVSDIYIAKADISKFKYGYLRTLRKENKGRSKQSINGALAMAWLNIGPSLLLETGIKPGYLIIDDEQIDEKKEELKARLPLFREINNY